MKDQVRIAIIGDFNAEFPPHLKTDEALDHVQELLALDIVADWIPTSDLVSGHEARLSRYDGVWVAPGSPYNCMDGALNAIRYCRETKLPLLGTCGGCQHVIIEFARNVLGIADAQHAEYDPYASVLIISELACSLVGQRMDVLLEPASRVAEAYSSIRASEQYYCNFGLNLDYQERLNEGGLRIVGRDADGTPRILMLPEHPFFVATVFVPQLTSSPAQPHPLIVAFVRAALARAPRITSLV